MQPQQLRHGQRDIIIKRDSVCILCVCVPDSKQFLNDIKSQISSVTDEIPLETLSAVSEQVRLLQGNITKYAPDVEKYESIR